MSIAWTGRELRQSPRIDVLMRVNGQLVPLGVPIAVHDLSRTGFAVISEAGFKGGQPLDFRLVGPDGEAFVVSAEAVHTRAVPGPSGLKITGFKFVPGRITGMLPRVLIDRLLEAVNQSQIEDLRARQ